MSKKHGYIDLLLFLISGAGYFCLQNIFPREDFVVVIAIYSLIFGVYLYWSFVKRLSFQRLVLAGVLFRLCIVTGAPNWSDDYFRFYWDAQMTLSGINPFDFTPTELKEAHPEVFDAHADVYDQLNSPHYYSVYPPVLQGIFALSAGLSDGLPGFIRSTQILIILSELLTVLLMTSLLTLMGKAKELSALYFLNPLIIVELTGNMHNEVFMVLFTVLALWLLHKKHWLLSAVALAFAVACKLYPVLFAPLLLLQSGKSWLRFGASFGIALALVFLPFVGLEEWQHIKSSIDLYYQKFEFNGGLYFLLRKVISNFTHFNPIEYLGPVLGFTCLLLVTNLYRIYLKTPSKHSIYALISGVVLLLYTTSTTVHPWYLSLMIAMAVFTTKRFAILWSFLIVLTYISYASSPYKENYWIVAIEWFTLLAFILWETFQPHKNKADELAEQT